MELDKVERTQQILINGEQPQKLGKKVKLFMTKEFNKMTVNEIIDKIRNMKSNDLNSDASRQP